MKILEISGENRLEFVEKCMLIRFRWKISTGHLNFSKLPAKLCGFGLRVKGILKKFKKNLRFFDQNLWKVDFFHIFLLNISWISDSAPHEHIYLWKITPDFYNNFSYFWGWGTFRRSPSRATRIFWVWKVTKCLWVRF